MRPNATRRSMLTGRRSLPRRPAVLAVRRPHCGLAAPARNALPAVTPACRAVSLASCPLGAPAVV
eukprot:4174980-Pyramimonas_sp.AAC.1